MSLLYTLLADQPHADVLADMDDARWRDMRKTIINAIIHTDMVHHFPMVAKVPPSLCCLTSSRHAKGHEATILCVIFWEHASMSASVLDYNITL